MQHHLCKRQLGQLLPAATLHGGPHPLDALPSHNPQNAALLLRDQFTARSSALPLPQTHGWLLPAQQAHHGLGLGPAAV